MIFGREPAVIAGVIAAVVGMAAAVGWIDWTPEQTGAFMAAVVAVLAVVSAFLTHDTLLALGIGAIEAVAAAVIGFGFNLSPDATAGFITLVIAVSAFYQRTQTSPEAPSFNLAA